MAIDLGYKCAVLSVILVITAAGLLNKQVMKSAQEMEREFGVVITTKNSLSRDPQPTQPGAELHFGNPPTVSPDGGTIAWSSIPLHYKGEKIPFVTLDSVKRGVEPIWLEGHVVVGAIGLSSEAAVIVAVASPLQGSRRELLAVDRHAGLLMQDLTKFVTQFEVTTDVTTEPLEEISVSGKGTLVALGTTKQIQVLEVPSGKTVYTSPGRFPRLSPDGMQLAFVSRDKLWIHSFADGSTKENSNLKRVRGLGGWSPNGRFLLAGAWTTLLALEKRQVIVDMTTGEYAVIDKLGEGDYGTQFIWASAKLRKDDRH